MFDALIVQYEHWHANLAPTIRLAFDFFFIIVIVRGIFAHKIMDIINIVLSRFFQYFQARFVRTERDLATWLHYQNKAANHGHNHTIRDCNDDKCGRF